MSKFCGFRFFYALKIYPTQKHPAKSIAKLTYQSKFYVSKKAAKYFMKAFNGIFFRKTFFFNENNTSSLASNYF